jgi:hypothetical protein
LPHPPSPTTTIFFEYAGPSVIWVAVDSRPVDVMLIIVLTVPSLDLAFCSRRVGFLRGASSLAGTSGRWLWYSFGWYCVAMLQRSATAPRQFSGKTVNAGKVQKIQLIVLSMHCNMKSWNSCGDLTSGEPSIYKLQLLL